MASCWFLYGPFKCEKSVFFFGNLATNVCNNILNFITSAITFYNVRIFEFFIFQAYCLMPSYSSRIISTSIHALLHF